MEGKIWLAWMWYDLFLTWLRVWLTDLLSMWFSRPVWCIFIELVWSVLFLLSAVCKLVFLQNQSLAIQHSLYRRCIITYYRHTCQLRGGGGWVFFACILNNTIKLEQFHCSGISGKSKYTLYKLITLTLPLAEPETLPTHQWHQCWCTLIAFLCLTVFC